MIVTKSIHQLNTILVRWLIHIILFFSIFNGYSQINPAHNPYPDTVVHSRLYSVITGGTALYLGGISYLSFVWYSDHERVPFHFYDDSKGYLQMDKLGHAYASYWESYAAYRALRWSGLEKRKALLWGGPIGFIFQAPVEIFDGLYQGWGFSWWDVAANAFGSFLFTAQELVLDQQLVLMKFSYWPSKYPKYHHILGENHFESFFVDYNAHTHWLSLNLRSVTGSMYVPSWLNLALGYSANGMIYEFENPMFYRGQLFPHLERYRQWFLSFDVDLSRVPAKRPWVRTLLHTINIVKIPFPALEYNRVDGVQFRPIYY